MISTCTLFWKKYGIISFDSEVPLGHTKHGTMFRVGVPKGAQIPTNTQTNLYMKFCLPKNVEKTHFYPPPREAHLAM